MMTSNSKKGDVAPSVNLEDNNSIIHKLEMMSSIKHNMLGSRMQEIQTKRRENYLRMQKQRSERDSEFLLLRRVLPIFDEWLNKVVSGMKDCVTFRDSDANQDNVVDVANNLLHAAKLTNMAKEVFVMLWKSPLVECPCSGSVRSL